MNDKWSEFNNAALALGRLGWSIFPARAGAKIPDGRQLPRERPEEKWSRENRGTFLPFVETPATLQQIDEWWTPAPRTKLDPPNIAVLAKASGVLVIDVDAYKASDDELAALRLELPETPLVVSTPSGGEHYYYRHPPAPIRAVTQQAHKYGGIVDVQSANYYVLAPPSYVVNEKHPERTGAYAWMHGTPSAQVASELPPAPRWVIADEFDRAATRVFTGSSWQSTAWAFDVPKSGIPKDGVPGRKQHVRSLALAAARAGDSVDLTIERLKGWSELRAKPPLSSVEVTNLVHVMYSHHRRDLGLDDEEAITLRVAAPSFPSDILRVAPTLHRWAATMSTDAHIHADLCCFAALMAVSTAGTGRYLIELEGIDREAWAPPAVLWGVAVAPSGSKKSTLVRAIDNALAPTTESLRIIANRFNGELEAVKVQLDASRREALKALASKDEARRTQAREILSRVAHEIEKLPPRLPTVWLASDVTPEAMNTHLASLRYLGLISEEGEDVLGGFFGRYGNGNNLNGLLKAHDRGSTTSLRVGRGVTQTEDPIASLLLTTQASGLSGLVSHEATDRGVNARILWAIVDTARMVTIPAPANMDRKKATHDFGELLRAVYYGGREASEDAIRRAHEYEPEFEEHPGIDLGELEEDDSPKGRGRPPKPLVMPASRTLLRPNVRERVYLLISKDAQKPAHELHAELNEGSKLGGEYHLSRSWAQKGREAAYRIAAVLALAASHGEAREVAIEFVEAAVRLVRKYFLPQIAAATDLMTWPAETTQAIHVLARFAERGVVKLSDIATELHVSTSRARHLVAWLEQRGAVETHTKGRTLHVRALPNVRY